MKIIVGITGASGSAYGIELLRACHEYGVETHLIMSEWAKKTIEIETSRQVDEVNKLADYHYVITDLAAAISSGSFRHDGMVIAPCSMKTLAAVSSGYSDNLIHRAADVAIKEGRKLILLPRETPLSQIHLENLLRVARLGAVILPPMPAMYIRPESVNDLVRHTVSRVLDQLGVENNFSKRWSGTPRKG